MESTATQSHGGCILTIPSVNFQKSSFLRNTLLLNQIWLTSAFFLLATGQFRNYVALTCCILTRGALLSRSFSFPLPVYRSWVSGSSDRISCLSQGAHFWASALHTAVGNKWKSTLLLPALDGLGQSPLVYTGDWQPIISVTFFLFFNVRSLS